MKLPRTNQREQLLLFAIGDRKIYGLEIQRRIERCTFGQRRISVSSLYPLIQSLYEKGLITAEWVKGGQLGGTRCYHSCTRKGKFVIKDIIATQQRLLED